MSQLWLKLALMANAPQACCTCGSHIMQSDCLIIPSADSECFHSPWLCDMRGLSGRVRTFKDLLSAIASVSETPLDISEVGPQTDRLAASGPCWRNLEPGWELGWSISELTVFDGCWALSGSSWPEVTRQAGSMPLTLMLVSSNQTHEVSCLSAPAGVSRWVSGAGVEAGIKHFTESAQPKQATTEEEQTAKKSGWFLQP